MADITNIFPKEAMSRNSETLEKHKSTSNLIVGDSFGSACEAATKGFYIDKVGASHSILMEQGNQAISAANSLSTLNKHINDIGGQSIKDAYKVMTVGAVGHHLETTIGTSSNSAISRYMEELNQSIKDLMEPYKMPSIVDEWREQEKESRKAYRAAIGLGGIAEMQTSWEKEYQKLFYPFKDWKLPESHRRRRKLIIYPRMTILELSYLYSPYKGEHGKDERKYFIQTLIKLAKCGRLKCTNNMLELRGVVKGRHLSEKDCENNLIHIKDYAKCEYFDGHEDWYIEDWFNSCWTKPKQKKLANPFSHLLPELETKNEPKGRRKRRTALREDLESCHADLQIHLGREPKWIEIREALAGENTKYIEKVTRKHVIWIMKTGEIKYSTHKSVKNMLSRIRSFS